MISIPVSDIANAEFSIVLNGQNCVLGIRQLGGRLYMTLSVDQQTIFENELCCNKRLMPVFETPLFTGKFRWTDSLGSNHPAYPGLGARYQLSYLTSEEVNAGSDVL